MQCVACGAESNPFTLQGEVGLRQLVDGGVEVAVFVVALTPDPATP